MFIHVYNYTVVNVSVTILAHHEFNTKEFEDITKEWFRQGGRLVRDKQKVAEGKNRRYVINTYLFRIIFLDILLKFINIWKMF